MMHFNTNIESEKNVPYQLQMYCAKSNRRKQVFKHWEHEFFGTFLKHINGCQPIVFTVHPTSAINRQEAVYIILIEYYRM